MKSYIQHILTAIISIFTPVIGLLIAVALAIFLDTVLGLYRSMKKRQKITSRKLSNIISKLVLYQTALLTIYGMDHFLLSEMIKHLTSVPYLCTKIVALILIFVEATSIKENFEEAFNINIFQKLKSFLSRGKELKSDVDDIFNN